MFVFLASLALLNGQEATRPVCRTLGAAARIPDLPEASGLALSHAAPGRLWSHNDSGKAILFALDTKGSVTARIPMPDIDVEDWEAVAAGPCPRGSCIYVADIGDNKADREWITVYRMAEPPAGPSVDALERFDARYPDGPRDAETLLVTSAGLFIVTKGDAGPVALYRFPRDLERGGPYQLERIGEARNASEPDWITDGTVSPDGRWVVLRTHTTLRFYPAASFLAGEWRESARVDMKDLGEPQGEGVALANDGTVYVIGEGGGESLPGSFASLACSIAEPGHNPQR
jgi:hypothetical protein